MCCSPAVDRVAAFKTDSSWPYWCTTGHLLSVALPRNNSQDRKITMTSDRLSRNWSANILKLMYNSKTPQNMLLKVQFHYLRIPLVASSDLVSVFFSIPNGVFASVSGLTGGDITIKQNATGAPNYSSNVMVKAVRLNWISFAYMMPLWINLH